MNSINEAILEITTQTVDRIFNLPLIDESYEKFNKAQPYPYLVIDNFLSAQVIKHIDTNKKLEPLMFSKVFSDEFQNKKTISTGAEVPQLVKILSTQFASSEILRYLEKLTGLGPLIADPHYNTEYGYYHIVNPGGVLGSHVDHSRHHIFGFPHVLNLVIYLTKDWMPEYGGALCLYDITGKKVIERVDCLYNRAVLFICHPTAYHGVEPVNEDVMMGRRSLYFAYYTVEGRRAKRNSSIQEISQLTTQPRNPSTNADETIDYPTTFIVPVMSLLKPRNWVHLRQRLVSTVKYLVPPFVLSIYRFIRRYISWRF